MTKKTPPAAVPDAVAAETGTEPSSATPENEVLRATRELKRQAEAAAQGGADPATPRKGQMGWRTAAGIGVGSAALMAALLYANRKRD